MRSMLLKRKNSQFKTQIRLYAIGNMVIFSRQLFEQIPAQKVRNGARKNGFAMPCEAVFLSNEIIIFSKNTLK